MYSATLEAIYLLIKEAGGVGTSWAREMLRNAFLVGYAAHGDKIIGTSTHKFPKEAYRKKIENATGLDLSGYLERGYTAVREDFRDRGIGGNIIRGLIERSEGRKIYVTIRMDNPFPLKMTYREGMILSATFINDRTGHELGVFTNAPAAPPRKPSEVTGD
ncbi:MAG TPA: hypothetical protein HPP58_02910 [Deltaproteobacteria bacterium]|nr:hypothetical protein [Deltaproteobacteria bacterium]HIJ36238.1 hypothetical protein [Deltaproteobacteria bacterium]HIJ40412.1 hypothetical protein [Deltaproteobacteria bacterium]